MGLVINEALSYGLPIVTTDKCLAGVELVTDGINGFIVEVNNVDDVSEKIKIILDNEELREKNGVE